MIETPLGGLFYLGKKNEAVTVTVEPLDTTMLAEFTLNGITKPVPANGIINFNLSSNGSATSLQLVLDFNSPSGGSYLVTVSPVTNVAEGNSIREWLQAGSAVLIKNYIFDAV